MRLAFVLAALTLGGCQLYFGGDDEPPTCGYGGAIDDGYPSNLLRNPETGDCQDFGYGGGYPCDGTCGPCPEVDVATTPPIPNWPACESSCSLLDEETCLAEPGCQVAYWEDARLADAPSITEFRGCYATTAANDIYTSCWNLDSWGCSQHDNCSLFYAQNYETPGATDSRFSRCAPEASLVGCEAVDCGIGYHCEDSCYPTPGGGPETDCGGGGGKTDCTGPAQCTPMCVPDSGHGCELIDCQPGYQCVEACETMDPSTAGPFPGQCYGTCVPTTACETLTTEGACNTRNDCTSVYNGDDCTCYPGGYCECEVLTWDHCESLGGVPLPL